MKQMKNKYLERMKIMQINKWPRNNQKKQGIKRGGFNKKVS